MSNLKIASVGAAPLDTKELVSLIDSASGNFAYAQEQFAQLGALFEAIVSKLPDHSVECRLAKIGENLCEDLSECFLSTRDEFNAHTERFMKGGAHE